MDLGCLGISDIRGMWRPGDVGDVGTAWTSNMHRDLL